MSSRRLAAAAAGLAAAALAASPVHAQVMPPAPAAEPEGAVPVLSTAPIPFRIGDSNGAGYRIRLGARPPTVTAARWELLVRNSARRWGLHYAGTLGGRARPGNGRSEIGFSELVPRGALGVTTYTGRRFRGRVERDVLIRPDVRWEAGPLHPDRTAFDLETVIIHELGHFAGNGRHVRPGCRDTPMVVGLSRGEWWRSSKDFFYRACAQPGAPGV
jgi:hypothetical protein